MSEATLKATTAIGLEAPRVEEREAFAVAGQQEIYSASEMFRIPAQWQRFAPHIGKIPGQVGGATYGVAWNLQESDADVAYLTGVEVSDTTAPSKEFSSVKIPAQGYLVFAHRAHVSRMRETMDEIARWLPQSGYSPAEKFGNAPDFFERYSEEFNPLTGLGGMEVWVPIKG